MVEALVRVHLTTLWRTATASAGRVVALLLGLLYALGGLAAVVAGLAVLAHRAPGLHGAAVVIGAALFTCSWLFATLLTGGGQGLDAGRLALFDRNARQFLPGLLVVALLGPGAVAFTLVAVAVAVSWVPAGAAAVVAALVGGALGVLGSMLACRLVATWFARALAARRTKDVAGVVVGLLAMTVGVGMQVVVRALGEAGVLDPARLRALGQVVAWTPLGWAWALPWDAATGRWGAFAARLLLAAALVAVEVWLWERSIARALVSPLVAGGQGGRARGHRGLDRLVPWTPAGAVAWRSLVLVRRDPRRISQLVGAVVLPAVMAVGLLSGDGMSHTSAVRILPVLAGWAIGSTLAGSDTNHDGNALWMQVVAGLPGRSDRAGRLAAAGLLVVPVVVAVDVALTAALGRWVELPAVLGTSLGAALVSAAVATTTSAWVQVALPPAGSGVFTGGQGAGLEGFLVGLAGMAASAVLAAPPVVLAVLVHWHGWAGWGLLAAGPAWGLVWVVVACRVAGRHLDATWPEVLQRLTWDRH